jgi:integrase
MNDRHAMRADDKPSVCPMMSNTELFERYVDYLTYVRNLSKHYIRSVKGILPKFLSMIGDKPLSEVKRPDIEQYIATLRKRKLSNRTAKYHAVILNKFFTYLVDHEYITRNPATVVMKDIKTYKKRPGNPRRKRSLTPQQAGHLINTAHLTRMKAILAIGFFTGMRIHEISYLDMDSLDLDNLTIWVPEKGKRSYGELFITPECVKIVKRWLKRREELMKTSVYRGDKKSLFLGMTPNSMGRAVSKVAKAAGFEKTSAHDMRYFFTNVLADAGMSSEAIGKLRGDAAPDMVGYYREIDLEKLKQDYLDRMPRLGVA